MSGRVYTEGYNSSGANAGLRGRISTLFQEEGMREAVSGVSRFVKWRYCQLVKWPIEYQWYRLAEGDRTFKFRDRALEYCWHRGNRTWNSERAIEIPIAFSILDSFEGDARVLEVGNVLRQYQEQYRDVSHPVVDKYETGPDIDNEDIVEYDPGESFDLILSISTLEHVGFDEEDGSPEKFADAVVSLRGLLAPGGRLVFSVPLGYNEEMESQIGSVVELDEAVYLHRTSADNIWEEIPESEAGELGYGDRYPKANELLVGMVTAD